MKEAARLLLKTFLDLLAQQHGKRAEMRRAIAGIDDLFDLCQVVDRENVLRMRFVN